MTYKSRAYNAWDAMKQRCRNKNNTGYASYGGRGIDYCEEWEHYDAFLLDMGQPGISQTIDRVDNNKGYFPENCRWASMRTQCNNKRDNHQLKYLGENKTLQQWGELLGIKPNTILTRIRRGWSTENALGYQINESLKKRSETIYKKRKRNCLFCDKEFVPRKQQIDNQQGIFCSVKCSTRKAIGVRRGFGEDYWINYGKSNVQSTEQSAGCLIKG